MNFADKIDTPVFHALSETADSLGLECYAIGGYVRDLLLHRPSKDIDVVVVGSGIEMAKAFAKRIGKGANLAVFKTYGTAQVKRGDVEVEFVGARRESYHRDSRNPIVEEGTLEDDQNRRDFTVNALAICLNKKRFGELTDPFGGLADMERKILRTPLDPDVTFSDDPLRMMRAVRFATQLRFTIEQRTFEAIGRNSGRIEIITKERITDELNKIMQADRPSTGFILMEQTGLLTRIFPELDRMKGVDKRNGRGHKDVFLHTLKVVDSVAEKSDDLWLRWAALLHDIGKPATKQWDEKAGWTFRNHNFIGSKMVPGIFRRLRLPLGEPMKFVQKMVDLHMRPIVLSEDVVTDSAVRRLLFDAGDDIDKLMLLCESDITSANREKVKRFSDNFQLVRRKLKELEEKDRIRNFQPPVDGEEIMRVFGIPPCNVIGELKSQIKDAILDGKIANEHDAAYQLLLKIAAERGLYPVERSNESDEP
ncbi:MAG: HD domain-containing protein [bacterium]|uniref:HD domain-containing protein n=1 Tax=Candidatus Aphodosoma intestinipullorum TaxID=2840674 RepID=A0A940DKI6_9BACT|nr:HD domain-containing protein [Candidatus Aphodosoma intestinipullorum]